MSLKPELSDVLRGMRILVVDDEFLIALTIEQALGAAGAEIVSAATLAEALKITAEEHLSAALLDVRLGHQTSEDIADILASRAIPFIFYSGQPLPERIREKHPDVQVLMKPIPTELFVQAIRNLVDRTQSGTSH